MINCAYENYGCNGGYLIPAIDFLTTEGVAPLSCFPYIENRDSCSSKCKAENKRL